MDIQKKFKEKHPVPNHEHITEYVYDMIGTGACQCHGNCDCYKNKGKVIGQWKKYQHPLKDKKYHTLEICLQSYNSCSKKNQNQNDILDIQRKE